MLTSKQRAYLKGLATSEDTIIHIGKGDISENIIEQTRQALHARELVKGKVLETSSLSAREACDILCNECKAQGVQSIGSKFVLYKRNEKDPRIQLPKVQKK